MNNDRSIRSTSQFAFGKIFLMLSAIVVSFYIGKVIWWSFTQTWDYFKWLDAPDSMNTSLAFSVIFTLGQGVALYIRSINLERMRDLEKLSRERGLRTDQEIQHQLSGAYWTAFACLATFVTFYIVDSATNIAEMWSNSAVKTVDRIAFIVVIGICVTMFEEVLALVISVILNTFNDLREIRGKRRVQALDMFARMSNRAGGNMSSRPVSKSTPVNRSTYRHSSFPSGPSGSSHSSGQAYHPIRKKETPPEPETPPYPY